jgi:hypothetical protein
MRTPRKKSLRVAVAGLGAVVAATGPVVTLPAAQAASAASAPTTASTASAPTAPAALPVHRIERILRADGTMSGGVLAVEEDRSDVHAVGGRTRSPFVTGFQLQHEIYFESLGRNRAIMNGDMSLKPGEIQPVISTLLAHGLKVQAEHQHLYDISPMMWFVHFRGVGAPGRLARSVEAAIRRTSTPQPQSSPEHPTTSLPARRLAHILGGEATIGENGVVTVDVDRTDRIRLGGVAVKPGLNVSSNVQFEPGTAGRAVAVADVAMVAAEVDPVLRSMRGHVWESGCLYNQETAEQPQLYFDHFFKTGDPVHLAGQIRRALDRTASER